MQAREDKISRARNMKTRYLQVDDSKFLRKDEHCSFSHAKMALLIPVFFDQYSCPGAACDGLLFVRCHGIAQAASDKE